MSKNNGFEFTKMSAQDSREVALMTWLETVEMSLINKGLSDQEFGLKMEPALLQALVALGHVKQGYRPSAAPEKWKKDTGIRTDRGIDYICQDFLGNYIAVQCKSKKKLEKTLSYGNISNFNDQSRKGKFFRQILITNVHNISKTIRSELQENYIALTRKDLLKLGAPAGLPEVVFKAKPLRKHQAEAVALALKNLKQTGKTQVLHATGTGKTLTGLTIYKELDPKVGVLLFPSLQLIRQASQKDYKEHFPNIPQLYVCSDKTLDDKENQIGTTKDLEELRKLGNKVTTSINEIRLFLKNNKKCIIFCTYQSFPILRRALARSRVKPGLALYDEAHKSVGSEVHNLNASNTVYMTATPRIGRGDKKKDGMTNFDKFGTIAHEMPIRRAIEQNLLVDYRIAILITLDRTLPERIKNSTLKNCNYGPKDIALVQTILKARKKYKKKRCIVFFNTIAGSQRAFEAWEALGKKEGEFSGIVSGKMSTVDRASILEELAKNELGVVFTPRCLNEGIDIPALDMVVFADPKNSVTDITQICGRPLRLDDKDPNKEALILIPMIYIDDSGSEINIGGEEFDNAKNIINTLRTSDSVLESYIENMGDGNGDKRPRIDVDTGLDDDKTVISIKDLEKQIKQGIRVACSTDRRRHSEKMLEIREFRLKLGRNLSPSSKDPLERSYYRYLIHSRMGIKPNGAKNA